MILAFAHVIVSCKSGIQISIFKKFQKNLGQLINLLYN